MAETTKDERDRMRGLIGRGVNENGTVAKCLRDADRLARLENGIRALVDKWENEDCLDPRFAFTPLECAQQARDLLDGE